VGVTAWFPVLVAGLMFLVHRQGAAEGEDMTDPRPRGIRNNNPGNIEYSAANDWQGQTGSDGRYAVFADPVWGIRAMGKVLDSYGRRGVDTVAEIVATWAPESENPTGNYIATVEELTGLTAASRITRADYPALVEAMIYFENGEQPYSRGLILDGMARL